VYVKVVVVKKLVVEIGSCAGNCSGGVFGVAFGRKTGAALASPTALLSGASSRLLCGAVFRFILKKLDRSKEDFDSNQNFF